jgi:hypothetical protein
VVVFDGDPVVGRALELLLRDNGRNTKFLDKRSLKRPGALEGVRVILLAPGWSAESRRTVLTMIENDAPATARRIKVLEIGAPPESPRTEPGHHVPWPCRTEDLKRHVDAVLLAKSVKVDGAS